MYELGLKVTFCLVTCQCVVEIEMIYIFLLGSLLARGICLTMSASLAVQMRCKVCNVILIPFQPQFLQFMRTRMIEQ